ncbi:hypothetical protein ANTQUA_LOCUS9254 [Anthophora quadrimaculata]
MEDQRFRVHVCVGQGGQVVDEDVHFFADYAVQLVETAGEGAGERVSPEHLPAVLLHLRPVAERKSLNIKGEKILDKSRDSNVSWRIRKYGNFLDDLLTDKYKSISISVFIGFSLMLPA